EDIDADTIRHLTLASDAQQAKWLELFVDPTERAPRGWQMKQWLWGAEIATDAALFPLDAYSGGIVSDLFHETGYFDDPDQFWALQNAAIARKRDALAADGWSEVIVLDVGARFLSWAHVATAKEDGGRVYIEVRETGEVTSHEGFVTRKEHERRRRQAQSGDEHTADACERPELTQAAEIYLTLHRHAAVRHALLAEPAMALRLMLAHAIVGSTLWQVRPEPQQVEKEATAKSLEASKAQAEFASERQAV
ncbi:MAG: chromosome partitioning protein ParB, partial [Alphaproteobacteria bacterium]